MRELVTESVSLSLSSVFNPKKTIYSFQELEYLSIADSKLKENTTDFLYSLLNNPKLKILDIR